MPEFEYEGRTHEGRPIGGSVTAGTRSGAARALNRRDLFVSRITPVENAGGAARAAPHATLPEVAWQMWQLSVMVDTGIGLADALACLARQTSRLAPKTLLEQIAGRVRDGASLSEAMARYPDTFPVSLVALIRASELSGTVGEVLRRASSYLASDVEVRKKVRGAALYPVIMLALCLCVATFLLAFVMPQFASIFSAQGATLPVPTRLLMGISQSLIAHWPLWLGGAGLLSLAGFLWARSPGGHRQFDTLVITMPMISRIANPLFQSRSFRTMSVLLDSHVSLDECVKVIRDVIPNAHYQELWHDVEEQIHVGESFATPFLARSFIPESLAQVIANGDKTGKLGKSFAHLAEFTEAEYNRAITNMTKLIEPLMILIIGSLIAFVAISLLLPLFQASQVMAR